MKKLNIFCHLALAGLMVLGLGSCKDSDDVDTVALEGPQVYFRTDEPSTLEIDPNASSFEIKLHRQDASGKLVVPITFEPEEGNIFNVPSQVEFADGETEATIKVTYDPNEIELGKYVGGTLHFDADKLGTPYGNSSYTFRAGASPWTDALDANGNPIMVRYREALIVDIFGAEEVVYNVPLQTSASEPGMYRLVNPYGYWYEDRFGGYNEPGDYDDSNDYYMVINAQDPDFVWVTECNTGTDWGYGSFMFTSMVQLWLEAGNSLEDIKAARPDMFGQLKDNVITMPAGSMLWAMSNYEGGQWVNQCNTSGKMAIALPGGVLKDYSAMIVQQGRFTNMAGEDFARINFTYGKDVTNASYALIPFDEFDAENIQMQLTDGTIPLEKLTGSNVTEEIPFAESGDYVMAVLLYDSGELVDIYYFRLTLTSSADDKGQESYQEFAAGYLQIGVADFSSAMSQDGQPWGFFNPFGEGTEFPIGQEAVLMRSTKDPTHFAITPWWFEDTPLYFTFDQETGVVAVDTPSGWTNEGASIDATDVETLYGQDLSDYNMHSYFDAESGSFVFFLTYHSTESYFGAQVEIFQMYDGDEEEVKAQVKKVRAARDFEKRLKLQSHQKRTIDKQLRRGLRLNKQLRNMSGFHRLDFLKR